MRELLPVSVDIVNETTTTPSFDSQAGDVGGNGVRQPLTFLAESLKGRELSVSGTDSR